MAMERKTAIDSRRNAIYLLRHALEELHKANQDVIDAHIRIEHWCERATEACMDLEEHNPSTDNLRDKGNKVS